MRYLIYTTTECASSHSYLRPIFNLPFSSHLLIDTPATSLSLVAHTLPLGAGTAAGALAVRTASLSGRIVQVRQRGSRRLRDGHGARCAAGSASGRSATGQRGEFQEEGEDWRRDDLLVDYS